MKNMRFVLVMVALGAVAWTSNPDEKSFQTYAAQKLAPPGLEGVFGSIAKAVELPIKPWTYTNYAFVSLVTISDPLNDQEIHFVGVLGKWIPLR